ncbi:MAG: mannonate dehydratase, partial [Firmicutes bacterium]|nr:mannonate dehydratase [Bacillota bacterium]
MRMVFRWFGPENDRVTLDHIRQIPGVKGVAWALHNIPVGEEWPMEQILEVREQAATYGLNTDVVESVNVHEDIKLGLSSRDRYIENYRRTIEKLGKSA